MAAAAVTPAAYSQSAGDFRSNVATGTYATAGSWETFNGSIWNSAGVPPTTANGQINIRNGHNITMAAAMSADQLIIDAGGQLTMTSGVFSVANGAGTDLLINGTLLNSDNTSSALSPAASSSINLASGGTYIHNATSGISAALNFFTIASDSNFIYRGSSTLNAAISISGRTYGNLAFESSSGTWNPTAFSGAGAFNTSDFNVGSGVNINLGTYTGVTTFNGNITIAGTYGQTNGARSFNAKNGKTLQLSSGGTLSVASGQTATIDSGATAKFLGTGVAQGAGNFTLSSGASFVTDRATGLDGAIQMTGTESFSTGANYEFQGAATGASLPATVNDLTINNSSGAAVSLGGAGATQTVNGTLKVLAGDLDANGTRTTISIATTGDAIVMRGDTQILSNASIKLTGASGGDIVFDATNNDTANIAASIDLGGQTRTFVVADGTAFTDMQVTGAVTNGNVIKSGLGKLVLTANNTYAGSTAVSGGTLQVDGSIIGSGVTVSAGGKLGGNGTINTTVALVGGTLSPGASIGALTTGALTLSTGTYDFEFSYGGGTVADNAVSTGADLWDVGGQLSIANAVTLVGTDLGTAPFAALTKFTVFSYLTAGTPTATNFRFANAPVDGGYVQLDGVWFKINYADSTRGVNGGAIGGGQSYVTLTTVPEASSILVMGLCGVFAIGAVWFGQRFGITAKA